MRIIRRILHWALLPLLLAGSGNALVWCLVFLRSGPSPWRFAPIVASTLVAGFVTPKGHRWFGALCTSLPVLLAPDGHHGLLLSDLVWGFLFPLGWAAFLFDFAPVFLANAAFIRVGYRIRKAVAGRWHLTIDNCTETTPPWQRITPLGWSTAGVYVLGNWIGSVGAMFPINRPIMVILPVFLLPGKLGGLLVSHVLGEDYGMLATAVGNGFLYALDWYTYHRATCAPSHCRLTRNSGPGR